MILKVTNRRQLHSFIHLPKALYRNNPRYTCPIFSALKKELNREVLQSKNYTALLALKDGKPVGRILYTVAESKQQNARIGYFSFFDCINDETVAHELFSKMECDLKKRVNYVEGPFTPYDPDTRRGVLIKGFDEPHTFLTSFNFPYYASLLETVGYQKASDQFTVKIPVDFEKNETLERLAEFSAKRYAIRIDSFDRKNVQRDVEDVASVFRAATTKINYQEAPDASVIFAFLNSFGFFLNPNLIKIAREEKTGRPVGFSVTLLDFNEILQKTKGKINPFAFLFLRKRLSRARGMLQYVIPEFQNRGTLAQLFFETQKTLKQLNVPYFEGGTILEENPASWKPFVKLGGEISKVYRIYGKEL